MSDELPVARKIWHTVTPNSFGECPKKSKLVDDLVAKSVAAELEQEPSDGGLCPIMGENSHDYKNKLKKKRLKDGKKVVRKRGRVPQT